VNTLQGTKKGEGRDEKGKSVETSTQANNLCEKPKKRPGNPGKRGKVGRKFCSGESAVGGKKQNQRKNSKRFLGRRGRVRNPRQKRKYGHAVEGRGRANLGKHFASQKRNKKGHKVGVEAQTDSIKRGNK